MAEATVKDGRGYRVTGRIVAVHGRGIVEIEDPDTGRRYYGQDLTRASARVPAEVNA
jgi:hypothetical protein